MAAFILIDLCSQADAVLAQIHGAPPTAILAWLRQYGDVIPPPEPIDTKPSNLPELWTFRSYYGPTDLFYFDADNALQIIQLCGR
jgi:hypothetical protein